MGSLHNGCLLEQNSVIGGGDDQHRLREFSPDFDVFIAAKIFEGIVRTPGWVHRTLPRVWGPSTAPELHFVKLWLRSG
jgi:hypothetical protein